MDKRVFNQDKTQELEEYDLTAGKLVADKLFVRHHEAVPEVVAQTVEEKVAAYQANGQSVEQHNGTYYLVVAQYPNGGKDIQEVTPTEASPAKDAYDEYEDIYVYKPYTAEELVEQQRETLRARRAAECFPIVNRGALWYDKLTAEQMSELSVWYEKWLDAPQTLSAPVAPSWISVGKKTE